MKTKGFTIIELLVTISIMLVILGGGIASFIGFNDKQQVTTAVKDVQTMLRAAQIKAKTGEGAGDCIGDQKLNGYRVKTTGNGVVIMERVCVGSSTTNTERSRISMDGVTSTAFDMIFHSLKGGVTGSTAITITGNIGSNIYDFDVSSLGEITQGAYQ